MNPSHRWLKDPNSEGPRGHRDRSKEFTGRIEGPDMSKGPKGDKDHLKGAKDCLKGAKNHLKGAKGGKY